MPSIQSQETPRMCTMDITVIIAHAAPAADYCSGGSDSPAQTDRKLSIHCLWLQERSRCQVVVQHPCSYRS